MGTVEREVWTTPTSTRKASLSPLHGQSVWQPLYATTVRQLHVLSQPYHGQPGSSHVAEFRQAARLSYRNKQEAAV